MRIAHFGRSSDVGFGATLAPTRDTHERIGGLAALPRLAVRRTVLSEVSVRTGVGVQEATVVVLAQRFGVDRETALSMALVKRARELLFGGRASRESPASHE